MEAFDTQWNFLNCCGAMDCKHVTIRCPSNTGSHFYNYKNTFSLVFFAVADADCNFLYIDVGTNGRCNDAAVFSKCAFNQALETNSLHVPPHGVFVADDAFPLRTNILKPYSRCGQLTQRQEIFNYRLSRARRVVENAFGILVSRFRVFERPIPLNVTTTEQLVKATCALHNWLRKTSPASAEIPQASCEGGPFGGTHAGFDNAVWSRSTNHSRAAATLRDHYAEVFETTYSVPWQARKI